MTFDIDTDRAGAVEAAARAAYQETLDLVERLGGAAEGMEGSAVCLGLCALLSDALKIGVRWRLPDNPRLQLLGVSAEPASGEPCPE